MDRELRDWLRSLSDPRAHHAPRRARRELSDEGAEYLARVATDGTLKAVFAEFESPDSDLAG